MKVSEITAEQVVEYLRIDEPNESELTLVKITIEAAKAFVRAYTGLDDAQIDTHEDFWIAIMVLCQDMYDNRTYYADKSNGDKTSTNKVVDAVLGMHCVNLL